MFAVDIRKPRATGVRPAVGKQKRLAVDSEIDCEIFRDPLVILLSIRVGVPWV